jgi:hypothetical protein
MIQARFKTIWCDDRAPTERDIDIAVKEALISNGITDGTVCVEAHAQGLLPGIHLYSITATVKVFETHAN